MDRRAHVRPKAPMIRSLFAYIFLFTAGLASAAAYFYSIHPEHVPEDDFPRVRLDLEGALERARRAKDAWEQSPPVDPKPVEKADNSKPPAPPAKPKREAGVNNTGNHK